MNNATKTDSNFFSAAADVDMLIEGNPSKAIADPAKKNNFLMNKEFFTLVQ